MIQRFIRFPEFAEITEFNKGSVLFKKNSIELMNMSLASFVCQSIDQSDFSEC